MPRKQIAFEVTEDEHAQIKELACKRRQSIKGLMCSALDALAPGWNEEAPKVAEKKEEK